MKPGRVAVTLALPLVAVLGAACSGFAPGGVATSATGTVAAIDTLAASTRQALSTRDALPTATAPGLAPAIEPAPTGSATPSATAASVWIEVRIDTACRVGPGKPFEMIGALLVGERTRVLQRSTYPDYWVVDNPDRPGHPCYLWGKYATLEGDVGSLPLDVTPTATPEPASIAGWSYIDRNSNGQRDPGESGEAVPYARFLLKLGSCPGGELLRQAESNAYGRIYIPGLLGGTYCLLPAPGQPALLPDQLELELAPNQQLDDINFRRLP